MSPAKLLAVPAVLLAIAGAGGLLFAWSGLYDIGARQGHWQITRAFLAFAMRSSVRHHADGIVAPPLDDPAAVHLGLAHYEAGCAPC